MEHWIPLLQSGAWIGLIIWLVVRYGPQIKTLIRAIEERITTGSSFKAGPFEIGSSIRPQSTAEQIEQIQIEFPSLSSNDHPHQGSSGEDSSNIDVTDKSRPLISEDLVLRILQEEYGVLINRQISAGAGLQFDGFFVSNNIPHAIEVRYFGGYFPMSDLIKKVQRIHEKIWHLGWKRFKLVLAIVIDDNYPPSGDTLEAFIQEIDQLGTETVVRVFPFSEVVGHFGIDLFESESD